jgi:hypothetical protein
MGAEVFRQNANILLASQIAKCNYLGMPPVLPFSSICADPLPPDPPLEIALAPRPWLTRTEGECAFPVDGESWATRSCCNPCGDDDYCAVHMALARIPRRAAR